MARPLFDPSVLDRLEGLSERYALLSRRLEQLQDQATSFDQRPDPGQLASLEGLRRQVRAEAAALLQELLEALG